MSKRIAVVILVWNNRKYLEEFLPSVIEYSSGLADIVIADNASTDDSVFYLEANFPSIRIIRNKTNEGFTGGYNTALRQVDNEYFVLLNSDVKVTENWLHPLIELMDKQTDAGACQPKILSYHKPEYFEYAGAAGGFIDKYGYPFCRGRIFNSLEKDLHQYDDTRKIFWASGACMMIRATVYKELNGLDDNFFAHMEEIDLCWRIQLAGKHVYFCPDSSVYHVGGGSLHKSNPQKTYLNFRNNLLLIYKNAAPGKVKSILRIRFFLDALASLLFLFSGSFSDFKAVWKARRDYRRLKSSYKPITTRDNPNFVSVDLMLYPKSILWDYYVCVRKIFSSLSWN